MGEAFRHLEVQERHCVLLILDDSGFTSLPHKLNVPVVAAEATHGLGHVGPNVHCGSMVVVQEEEGRDTGWVGQLPWIRRPIVITAEPLPLSLHKGQPNLDRLEPIFFTWTVLNNSSRARRADGGSAQELPYGVDSFWVYEKLYYSAARKVGRFDGVRYHLGVSGAHEMSSLDHHHFPKFQLDFGGHEIPGVAFTYKPYSMPDHSSGQDNHGGLEYETAATVLGALNLRLVVRLPSTGRMWGRPDKHGNWSGEGFSVMLPAIMILTFLPSP